MWLLLQLKIEKMRVHAIEKMQSRVTAVSQKAEQMRAVAESNRIEKAAKTSARVQQIIITGQLPRLSHNPFRCCFSWSSGLSFFIPSFLSSSFCRPLLCNTWKVPYLEDVCTNPHPLDIHNMSVAIFHAIRPVWDPFSWSGLYPWYVRFHTLKVFAQIHILWTFTTCPLQFFMQLDQCETLSHQVDSTHDMSGLYCEGICRSSHPLVIPQHSALQFFMLSCRHEPLSHWVNSTHEPTGMKLASKGAFTLGVKDSSIKSPNTKLVI